MPQFILETIIWRTHIQTNKSVTTNSKTIARCDKEVDHRSKRNSRYIDDRLPPTFWAKDNFVNWQSSSVIRSKKPMYSPIQYCVWARWIKIPEAHGREKSHGLWIHPNVENWRGHDDNFSESGHPVFRGSSASKRGSLRSKTMWNIFHKLLWWYRCSWSDSSHDYFPSINSVSNGAVADMCDELVSRISDCSGSTGRPVAEDKSETMVVPTDLSTTTKPFENTNENSQIVQTIFCWSDCAPIRVSQRLLLKDSISWHWTIRNWQNWVTHVESTHYHEMTNYPK